MHDFIEKQCARAVKAVQMDLLYYIHDVKEAKKVLGYYEEKGIYPYKNEKLIRNKNYKQFVINIIYLMFPYKRVYLSMVAMLQWFSK